MAVATVGMRVQLPKPVSEGIREPLHAGGSKHGGKESGQAAQSAGAAASQPSAGGPAAAVQLQRACSSLAMPTTLSPVFVLGDGAGWAKQQMWDAAVHSIMTPTHRDWMCQYPADDFSSSQCVCHAPWAVTLVTGARMELLMTVICTT